MVDGHVALHGLPRQSLADSALVSDQHQLVLWEFPREQETTFYDRGGGQIAAHGIERNPHLLDRNDLAPSVVTTGSTGAVGQYRLIAFGAQNHLHRLAQLAVGSAPTIAPHLGCSFLGDTHVKNL